MFNLFVQYLKRAWLLEDFEAVLSDVVRILNEVNPLQCVCKESTVEETKEIQPEETTEQSSVGRLAAIHVENLEYCKIRIKEEKSDSGHLRYMTLLIERDMYRSMNII